MAYNGKLARFVIVVVVLTISYGLSVHSADITVAADGSGQHKTVQSAVDAAPANSKTRTTIKIKAGTYREIVTVPANKTFITFQGTGSKPQDVVIVDNKSAHSVGSTANSATVFIYGSDFEATDLTFSNDFDPSTVSDGTQALALSINSQRAVFKNVRMLGNQDTLLINKGARAYIANSYIEGTVDFIFGEGIGVIDNCDIYEKRSTGGPVTAAHTDKSSTYGFLIYKSRITGAGPVELGRPWGPDAQVVYRECTLDGHLASSQPWIDMSGNSWGKARFYEYKNTGAGAAKSTTDKNRPQLSDADAAKYTREKYLAGSDNWNPIQ